MILYIDTTDNDVAEIGIRRAEKYRRQQIKGRLQAEEFAALIESFVQKQGLQPTDIKKIAVRNGPGFFSRVRTGVVAANALAYALNLKVVPVKGELDWQSIMRAKGERQVAPVYSSPPNITKPHKKKYGL